jgi:hypothetical protein
VEYLSQRIHDVLAEVGHSADEIAETLDRRQIWGVRNTARFLNPIVRCVQLALSLGPFTIDLTYPETLRVLVDATVVRAVLPEPVKDFLEAFNHGAYPQLEADGVPGGLEVLVPLHA